MPNPSQRRRDFAARLQQLPDPPALPGQLTLNTMVSWQSSSVSAAVAEQQKIRDDTPLIIPSLDPKPVYGYLTEKQVEFGFAAAILKLSYSTDGDELNSLKDKIKANTIEQIAFTGITPSGLKIGYDDTDIYVIQGTTRAEQVGLYQQTTGVKPVSIGPGGINSVPGSGDGGLDDIRYFGSWYDPFIAMGKPWLTRIGSDLLASGGRRKVAVYGHSLGAAVVQLITNWAGFMALDPNRLALAKTIAAANPSNWTGLAHEHWNKIEYGFVLGCPRVCWWGRDDFRVTDGGDKDPAIKIGFPFPTISRRVVEFNRPGDPIPLIPAPYRGSPFYMYLGNATVGANRLGTQFVTSRRMPGYEFLQWKDRLDQPASYPLTKDDFMARVGACHGIQGYLLKAIESVQFGLLRSYDLLQWAANLALAPFRNPFE